ncbi:MAG: CoA-binding protein [Deltaproteobacteria bacterium]|nr:CoA-binding protein [Deltaproteobacteria bacterium]
MDKIEQFLECSKFAVAGASTDREKYGNKVLRCFKQNNRSVVPINPKDGVVEDLNAVKSVGELPDDIEALSIVTPPPVTAKIVDAAIEKGIMQLWMQPGSENEEAIKKAVNAGANVIYGGDCILVAMGYRE